LAIGTAVLAVVTGAALIAEGRLFDMDLPIDGVIAAMTHLGLLGLVFGSLALALGAATGHLGLARGVPAAVAVVAYLVNGLGGMVQWLEPFQRLSPFYQFAAHDPLRHGVSYPSAAVAVATVLVLVGLAVWGFRRRDIRA
jgi:ABC-2 type transport system permease protein